ncbi:LD-carboxypeptidase [Yersinia kristensenii]|uniref:LD-carboxypeptidase n=2 Tax=Yersinia kristensenii TaxID=28152 RepID=A0AB73PIL4_YERKR|nr:LD-carboxypeptidase [Yersinia kristensenii]
MEELMSRSFIINLLAFASVISQAAASTIPATIPVPPITDHHAQKKANIAEKPKIYLIASSSQYDESIIAQIRKTFDQEGYAIDTTYLDQNPTPLGYVNTDKIRAETLIKALTDNNVKYLWFVKGGSGALNLYPYLYANRKKVSASSPKILIGFSDVTVIHHYINNDINWPSIHGVLASYNKEMYELNKVEEISKYSSINEIFQTISGGVTYSGIEPMNLRAFEGGRGILNGGNLTLVQSLFSTRYEKKYSNKIMLLEDINVTYKQLDRMLHQLEYSKNFRPKAVIFGQFYEINAAQEEKELYRYVIQAFAKRVDYPVYYYPDFGHGTTNQPFILAQRVSISCNHNSRYCSLTQPPLTL